MVRLLFLGRFSELAPAGLEQIALPECVRTLSELWDWVAQENPGPGQVMPIPPRSCPHPVRRA